MKLLIILSLAMGGVPPDASTCSSPLDRASVARCARRNSPTLAADLERVASTRGEELEARTLLPSNPRVDLSLARRADTMGGRALNLYGTLSQAIELGGQRRKRVAVVQSQREVYQHRAALTEREAVAAALLAYYDALAAERELALIERATQTADRLHALAVERVGAGVGTGLDQELAAAVHARHEEERAMANGKLEGARARLSSLVGLDPTVESVVATGELEPVPLAAEALASLGDNAVQQRPEIAQARAVREVQSRRLDLLRRDRIPDPSL
ncbi:MAG: TolC family protein, partial [Deltaproteobacteria bacterium]|nr:TolC family protein [Deltaproteobacteria bacterium]